MSSIHFKAADNFTASLSSIDHATLLELTRMFGLKSSYVLEIRHPLNPEKVFRFEMTDGSKEDLAADRVV